MRAIAMALIVICTALIFPAESAAEEKSWWPPLPGVALKAGGGLYHSVPCACVDRGLFNVEVSGRLHFGYRFAMEADLQRGIMLLGGRFPSSGWAMGGRLAVLAQQGRWWEGLHVRTGYRKWFVMGMRADGAHGFYSGLSWAIETLPHLYLEFDALTGRTFGVMPHWNLEGRFGLSTRF